MSKAAISKSSKKWEVVKTVARPPKRIHEVDPSDLPPNATPIQVAVAMAWQIAGALTFSPCRRPRGAECEALVDPIETLCPRCRATILAHKLHQTLENLKDAQR